MPDTPAKQAAPAALVAPGASGAGASGQQASGFDVQTVNTTKCTLIPTRT